MRVIYLCFFLSILFFRWTAGFAQNVEADSSGQSFHMVILDDRIEYKEIAPMKDKTQKPFSIEAVFEFAECSNNLVSIDVFNAHPPLTWFELNEAGQRVHTLFNPQLNYFNDHTTYVVQDMTQHTDTIFIDFDQAHAVRRIYPNPHRGELYLDYSAYREEGLKYSVVDLSGRKIMEGNCMLQQGDHQMILDLRNLRQGVYFFSITGLCVGRMEKIIHLE